jgi:NOL1/NOP2/fmu family ribosome biogenesis protein
MRSARVPFVEIDGAPYADWWRDRFAPEPDPFDAMRFYQRGRANIWVGTADIVGLETTRMDAVGIHLLRVGRRIWKPTSTAIRTFGAAATINTVELQTHELRAFFTGSELELGPGNSRGEPLSRGFVAVCYRGAAVGCGEWHERGALVSLVPRSQRLADIDL